MAWLNVTLAEGNMKCLKYNAVTFGAGNINQSGGTKITPDLNAIHAMSCNTVGSMNSAID